MKDALQYLYDYCRRLDHMLELFKNEEIRKDEWGRIEGAYL